MPTTAWNNFEGPKSNNNVTTTYSRQGGRAFDAVSNNPLASPPQYDLTAAYCASGQYSVRLTCNASGGQAFMAWYGGFDLSTKNVYDRFYFMVPFGNLPNENTLIYRTQSDTANPDLLIEAYTGRLYLQVGSDRYYSNTNIVVGQMYRIEMQHYLNNSQGYVQVRIYDKHSTTPLDTSISTGYFNHGFTTCYRYLGFLGAAANFTIQVDEWVVSTDYNWIGPAVPLVTSKSNNFEGGTNGAEISYSNSQGAFNDPFNYVNNPGSNNMQFDNSKAQAGSFSVRMSGDGQGKFGWMAPNANILPTDTLYVRFYIYLSAFPVGGEWPIVDWIGSGYGGQQLWLKTDGNVRLYMQSQGTNMCTTTKAMTLNTWYRLEIRGCAAWNGANAWGSIAVYVGDSTTAYTTVTQSGTGSSNAIAYDGINFRTHLYGQYNIDNVAISTSNFPGPYVPPQYKTTPDTFALTESQSLIFPEMKTATDIVSLVTENTQKMISKVSAEKLKFAERTIPNVPRPVDWKTEIALTTSPNDPMSWQTWTDVSAYVLESNATSLRRGRSDEMSEIQPSSISLTIDNTDGRFTPGYTGGPYGTGIDMGKMIRRSAVIDGVAYPRFTGYIDTVNIPEWANSNHFHRVVNIDASDRLARIAAERAGPMLSAYEYEVMRLDPELFYPLTEETSSGILTNRSAYRFDPLIRQQNAGDTIMGGGDSWPAEVIKTGKFQPAFFDNGNLLAGSDWFRGELRYPIPFGTGDPVTICAWVTVDKIWTAGTGNLLPRIVELGSDTNTIFLGLNFQGMWTAGSGGATASTTPITPGTGTGPRFVAAVITPGQPVALYVDGTAYAGSTVPTPFDQLYIMNVGRPWAGSIGGVAVFRGALTSTQVQALYQAGYAGVEGMLSDEAMRVVAGYAGIQSSELVIDPPRGQTRVGKIPFYGRSRLDVMKDIVKAEGGIMFADPSGVIRFHTRGKRWNTGAAQLVIPPQEIKVTLGINYDDSYLINEAYVSREGGVTARAVWKPSQDARGIYTKKDEGLKFFTDAETMPRARSYVIQNNTPKPRMGSLPLSVTTSLIQKYLLQLDIGSIISLSGLSPDAPNFGRHFVEGITESQSVDEYTITISTSPVYSPIMAYMVVGNDWLSLIGGYSYIAP